MKTIKTHHSDPKIKGNKIIENKLREMNGFLAKVDLSATPKLSGEQIVQKKLREVNEMLKKADLSKLLDKHPQK